MDKPTCEIDDCDHQSVTRGKCKTHYMAEYVASRALPPDDARHGTHNGYCNHRCRCVACGLGEKEYQRRKAAESTEARAASKARYYIKNRARLVALNTTWGREHPRSVQVSVSNRRARQAGAPSDLTLPEWESIWEAYAGCCAYCGQPARDMDHVIALASGGPNTASNVVPACASCNASKKNTPVTEWRASRIS